MHSIWNQHVKPTTKPAIAADYKPENEPDQWVGFGRTPAGEQFAPYSQINAENVKNLEVAWTFHTGDITGNGSENQNTPLQIGNILYPCTPTNQVFAVRGDTGEKLWHFDPGVKPDATAHWMPVARVLRNSKSCRRCARQEASLCNDR
ncbi:hypothetical protein G6L97_23640 (plasmid) [Agrobacterium tumefaciens]|uniref:hypothetical protein n=1 Tax=Agrobacterium tumefaciens TaxID=358 RepID=UPI001B89E1C1|nr:hypothetical protein [Agrobacterium tumefaciens]WCA72668.1 hypothetical protein G6L97_23640 [Agrobacterium tumefaciens]